MKDTINKEGKETLQLTNHAFERYAERLMGYTNKQEILAYINEHKEEITARLNKMVQYGTHIFSGQTKDHAYGHTFVNKDGWCVVCDKSFNKIITVYKIDLGCSKELNTKYIIEMMEKLEVIDENLQDAKIKNDEQKEVWAEDIKNIERLIKAKKEEIEELEKNVLNLQNLIISNNAEVLSLRDEYKKCVEKLVGVKVY